MARSREEIDEARVAIIKPLLRRWIEESKIMNPSHRRQELQEIKKLWLMVDIGRLPPELRTV